MLRRLALLVILLASHATFAQAPSAFDVFVIAGQSNAEGWGDAALSPAIPPGVAYEYVDAATGLRPLLSDPVGGANTGSAWPAFAIEYYTRTGRGLIFAERAVGLTSLVYAGSCCNGQDWGPTSTLFPAAVVAGTEAVDAARAAGLPEVRLVGWLWSQGETDAASGIDLGRLTEAQFRAAWLDLQARFRAAVPGGRLFVSQTGTFSYGDTTGLQAIRRAQAELVAVPWGVGGPVAELAFSGAFSFVERGMMDPVGGVHYSQAGYGEMGRAMAVFAATSPAVAAEAEPSVMSRLAVYPNPARGRVTVLNGTGEAEVVDALGRIAMRSTGSGLDVSTLPPGRYIIRSGGAAVPLTVVR